MCGQQLTGRSCVWEFQVCCRLMMNWKDNILNTAPTELIKDLVGNSCLLYVHTMTEKKLTMLVSWWLLEVIKCLMSNTCWHCTYAVIVMQDAILTNKRAGAFLLSLRKRVQSWWRHWQQQQKKMHTLRHNGTINGEVQKQREIIQSHKKRHKKKWTAWGMEGLLSAQRPFFLPQLSLFTSLAGLGSLHWIWPWEISKVTLCLLKGPGCTNVKTLTVLLGRRPPILLWRMDWKTSWGYY